ncbi:C-C chemokine receptor type 2 [Larimichthys crocea]|uniref:C-C chemokine receptor type 2 n=1 Tax=Larimichthys crocea TaxID=215358 RepID=UPI000F5F751C|nr:C-C chemokine receptor type 2-like [Larimichthys crocea]XP_019127238.2 C-C chemokine receptor type 2-like [Larimichthys crocea]
MNTSENMSYLYNYEDNLCDESSSPDLLDSVTVKPVLCYVLFCLGLLGNTTVLWLLLGHIKLKTMTDVCLLNLALSDLILALSLPLWANNSDNLVSCKVMTGVYQLGFYSGTLFVILMSLDRYLAIVHAVAAMRARTLHYGITASIIIWVISVILAMPQVIFALPEIDEDNNKYECQPLYPDHNERFWKMLRNFSENTVGLFVGLSVMVFCYVKILAVLSKSRNSNKDRAIKLIFIIVCVFVVCWVPYNVLVFLQTLQLFEILNKCETLMNINSAMAFAEMIALSHCCVNPVIYAFIGEKFRRSMSRVLAKYLCWSIRIQRDTIDTTNTPVKSDYES